MKGREKNYIRYFAIPLKTAGMAVLLAANYLWFFENDKETGMYVAVGTILLSMAFLLEALYFLYKMHTRNPVMEGFEQLKHGITDLPAEIMHRLMTPKTLVSYLPTLLKLASVGTVTLTAYYILKRGFLARLRR